MLKFEVGFGLLISLNKILKNVPDGAHLTSKELSPLSSILILLKISDSLESSYGLCGIDWECAGVARECRWEKEKPTEISNGSSTLKRLRLTYVG